MIFLPLRMRGGPGRGSIKAKNTRNLEIHQKAFQHFYIPPSPHAGRAGEGFNQGEEKRDSHDAPAYIPTSSNSSLSACGEGRGGVVTPEIVGPSIDQIFLY